MEREKDKIKNKIIIILILIALIAIGVSIWAIFVRQPQLDYKLPGETSGEEVKKNEDSISIPGYEGITLKADSRKQEIAFNNPPQNTCYFKMSLYLEDGTLLWASGYIKPGKTSSPIVLKQKLEKGTYQNAVLKYSCYKMDKEKTPLNGAQTKLVLRAE